MPLAKKVKNAKKIKEKEEEKNRNEGLCGRRS